MKYFAGMFFPSRVCAELGKKSADEGDDEAVQDEAETQEKENRAARGRSLGGLDLRFRGHHGILPEPEWQRKCGRQIRKQISRFADSARDDNLRCWMRVEADSFR